MLRIWNTLHRRLEEFSSIEPGKVRLYACGPTVYYYQHIGNYRTYLFEDILVRVLRQTGYEVTHVMNVTDVGHLVGDGDVGEDKVEREAARTGKTAWEIAKFYEEDFFATTARLHIGVPSVVCRATEHIPEQIALVERLEEKGFVYRALDGMYFDTSRFASYGSFGGQKMEEKEAGARVEVREDKRHPADFALWKFSPTDEKRQMEWESPWGIGFPGWHVECSAMAKRYLGQPFDIHCGGIDHVPVHHENEIAQSEAAYDVPLARYWVHGEHLMVDGGKMGKSLGNGYTITLIEEKGFDALAFRYLCLGTHYRSKMNFTWEALQGAQNALEKVKRWILAYRAQGEVALAPPDGVTLASFQGALEDDLNTPKALACLHSLLHVLPTDPTARVVYATLLRMDEFLGLGMSGWVVTEQLIPADIQALIDLRSQARDAKQWGESDRLREVLREQGWLVEDHPGTASTARQVEKR